MIAILMASLAVGQEPEPFGEFVGTWRLVALSTSGLPRSGEGLLRIRTEAEGREAWDWSAIHVLDGRYWVDRRAGSPWPAIRATFDEGAIGGRVHPREGVYRFLGETLTLAFEDPNAPEDHGGPAFRPAPKRTVETYRRVSPDPDVPVIAEPFPSGSGKVVAEWDDAMRGALPNPPRGILNRMQLRDYGDGILIAIVVGGRSLDDPPAPSVDPKDVPTGTLVRPAGGRFDERANRVIVPAPTPPQQAVIDAFRAQNPEAPDRLDSFPGLCMPNVEPSDARMFGWDGVLASTRTEGDRTLATLVVRPRVLVKRADGLVFGNYYPLLIETWELRQGKLRFLQGGPDLTKDMRGDRFPYLPAKPARP